MKRNKNILICPLEWGLGHAARMIPLATELLRDEHNIIFASGEEHLSLIRNELPGCSYLSFPGFNPKYSRYLPPYISILIKIPLLLYHIAREHFRLKKIIREYSIDIVISDNRFGLWNRSIKTVYVTHMPLIPFPGRMKFLEVLGVLIHRQIIRKFDLCLIPDLPGENNLSGRLSHGLSLPKNVRYIGILSRFTLVEGVSKVDFNPPTPQGGLNKSLSFNKSHLGDLGVNLRKQTFETPSFDFKYNTVILSGPEPHKEILKQSLISVFKDKEPVTIILEGKPGKSEDTRRIGNIILYNHLPANRMKSIISGSEGIISRSGYSTVMDLISLSCRALLIPTPGQTEQEYLADYLSERGLFKFLRQSDIKYGVRFPEKESSASFFLNEESRNLLSIALKEISEEPHQQTKSKISKKETRPYL